jgi:tetratricopeptide (TPR) repeat protein
MKTVLLFVTCLLWFLTLQAVGQDRNVIRLQIRELHFNEDHRGIINLLDSVAATHDLSTEFIYMKGRALFNSGRNAEARSILRPLENDSLFGPRATQMLANIAMQQRNNNEALGYLLRLSRYYPENPVYHQRVARIFYAEENYPAALNYMLLAYRQDTLNQTSILELADIWMKLERPPNAFRLLSKGISLYPEHQPFRRQIVSVCYRQKKMQETVEHAAFLTERGDTTPTVVRLKAFAYFDLGELEKSEFWLNYLLDREFSSEDVYFYKGKVHEAKGNTIEALHYYEDAVKLTLSPNFNPFILQLAITFHENKQYRESINWLQTARVFSNRAEIIYYQARNFDLFYQDKQPALQHYQLFIDRAGDSLEDQRAFARQRIRELRELLHLQGE